MFVWLVLERHDISSSCVRTEIGWEFKSMFAIGYLNRRLGSRMLTGALSCYLSLSRSLTRGAVHSCASFAHTHTHSISLLHSFIRLVGRTDGRSLLACLLGWLAGWLSYSFSSVRFGLFSHRITHNFIRIGMCVRAPDLIFAWIVFFVVDDRVWESEHFPCSVNVHVPCFHIYAH